MLESEWKSDLFCENAEFGRGNDRNRGVEEEIHGEIRTLRWNPDEGRSAVMIQTLPIWRLNEMEYTAVRESLVEELRRMMSRYFNPKKIGSVLIVGVGNPSLISDALGPETVKRIAVTVPEASEEGTNQKSRAISAFVPDVSGNTGIETAALIGGIVSIAQPDLVLAVDALAAKSPTRLATVIQLSDAGISPGSGVGKHRAEISQRTLGVPVLALGIPTVVSAAAMFGGDYDFFVTLKEIDLIVQSASFLLSDAIHRACGIV